MYSYLMAQIVRYGNSMCIEFDSAHRYFAVPTAVGLWISPFFTIQEYGNSLVVVFKTGGVRFYATQTQGDRWLLGAGFSDPGGGTGPVDPGDGSIYNPWGVGRGDPLDGWESHASYSAGGYDWSYMDYGAGIEAPANGILHTSGGSGEYAAGNIGSAGLRSILYLDVPVNRIYPKSGTLMNGSTREADGPMAAIVFQHQSNMGEDLHHYLKGEILGNVGDSGNGVKHLHVHGLDAGGSRVDFFKFVVTTT